MRFKLYIKIRFKSSSHEANEILKFTSETTTLPFDPLWSTLSPWQQTARGHWPQGSLSLWSVLSAAGRTLHGRSCGSWWGWGRCGCRWTAACRSVRAGSAKRTATTDGEDWESGERLEVVMGERRQTLGLFRWWLQTLNSGDFNWI